MYDKNTDLFIADVRLVFRNCECFNAPGHEATLLAVRASEMFEKAIRDPSNYQTHIRAKTKVRAALAADLFADTCQAKKTTASGGGGGSSLSASATKIPTRPLPRKYAKATCFFL
jgi:hypothetical protein